MLDFLRLDNADILETKYKNGEIDRRQLLKAFGILGLASTAMGRIAFAQQKDLVLATWGGDTSKAIDSVFGAAFTKATNINVKDDGSGPTEGAVQAQAASGKISWDVLQLDYFSSVTLGKKGLLGPIDYNVVKKSRVLENSSHEFGVACFLNSLRHVDLRRQPSEDLGGLLRRREVSWKAHIPEMDDWRSGGSTSR